MQAAMARSLPILLSLVVCKYNDYLGIALTAFTFHSDQLIFISLPFCGFPSPPPHLSFSFFSVSF